MSLFWQNAFFPYLNPTSHLKENQKSFNEEKLKALSNDLNWICDENDLIRCEVKLKLAPLPYDAKTAYLINSEHYLARLFLEYFHRGLKHITIKQTLSELRQRFWICRIRAFVRKVLKNCTLFRRFEGQPFQYPVAPPLTKLRLYDKSYKRNT